MAVADAIVGLLHPGEMGSAVGAAARGSGAVVLWASQGRSAASGRRAARAGLQDAGTLRSLVERSGMIVSVVPPASAGEVARAVMGLGFRGTYLDANAVSPARTREIAALVEGGGGRFADGGIIGGPPWKPGTTRLYVSGPRAAEAVDLFAASPLQVVDLRGAIGAASALKMAYSAWTKGSQALIAAVLALAEAEGVDESLRREWTLSQPELASGASDRTRGVTAKAWRFVGEMLEIAATMETAGLPRGFHEAAAEIYGRMARFKDAAERPALETVVASLLKR
jgi:3-hydroxyisobutyrate dehydrogenase-like beta-hydroxyacid dehydrogenase